MPRSAVRSDGNQRQADRSRRLYRFGTLPKLLFQSKAAQAVVQAMARDPEHPRRLQLVSARRCERTPNQLSLGLFHGRNDLTGRG